MKRTVVATAVMCALIALSISVGLLRPGQDGGVIAAKAAAVAGLAVMVLLIAFRRRPPA